MKMSADTLKRIEQARALAASGMTIKTACEQAKAPLSTYYYLNKLNNKKTKETKPTLRSRKPSLMTVEVPENTSTPFVFIMGNPSDVNAALDRLAQIQGGAR